MSVDRKDYVMFAVDITSKKISFYDDEKFLPYIEGHKDCEFSIVDDPMSSKYCFFGKVLKTAEYYEEFNREPIDISFENVSDIKESICLEYMKLFDEVIRFNDVKLYCITQWL